MPNRLAAETSPYLRQHADNPVDWWPWCDEALALARSSRRPILLSIGYSSCHWCHVMAHESFEDEATAAVMNALFVNIKVDREERPDLDRIYQLAHQALTRRGGGWPLTVFLTPDDHLPYFAGTYFPKTPRYGTPPFVEVLRQVRQWYDQRRQEVMAQNAALGEFLRDYGRAPGHAAAALDDSPLREGLVRLERSFDPVHGGFGGAPKFPHAGDLALLLDAADASPDRGRAGRWRRMALHSLRRMAEGGIHDQLGGGFCRYSVDAQWAIPHFEKMLYDNALLLPLYARAAAQTGEGRFADAAEGIADWLEREMRGPDGGYCAALDADSEGEEGRFYLWASSEVQDALSPESWAVAAPHWGLDGPPNFEGHAWHLVVARPLEEVASALGLPVDEARQRRDAARARLFAERERRVRPGRDDKRLTAWNALLASGFAQAAAWLGHDALAQRARDTVAFLRRALWREGRLYASWNAGQARFPGYLDDHAFLLEALLDLLRVDPDPAHLDWALELAEQLLARFEDRAQGGFFFTADDHEPLIARLKPYADEALPSGNGVAARALLRLGHLTAEPRWLDAAERTLRAGWATMGEIPHGCATLLSALREFLQPPAQAVIRLPAGDGRAWRETARELGRQGLRCALLPEDAPVLPLYAARQGGVAYLCSGTRCLPPLETPAALREAAAAELGARPAGPAQAPK